MADSADRILKILLEVKSDVADFGKVLDGLKGVKGATDDAKESAFGLKQAFEFAGANEIIHNLVETLQRIPEQFVEAIKQGVEFNAHLQDTQNAIAGILRQNAGQKFIDWDAAKQGATEATDLLKAKANELGKSYEDMFETYQHSANSLFQGVGNNLQKQINLIGVLDRAMVSAGVNSTVAFRDIADILAGKAANTIGGRQLAPGMGFADVQEMDTAIQSWKQMGTLFEELMKRLGGIQEAGRAAGQSFTADIARMKNSITDLGSEMAKPLMGPLTDVLIEFTNQLQGGGTLVAVQQLGQFVANVVQGFGDLTTGIESSIPSLTKWAGVISGNPIFGYLAGKVGASQGTLEQGNLEAQLLKQAEALFKQIAAAHTLQEQALARLDLEMKIDEVKQKIATGDLQGSEFAGRQLAALQEELVEFDKKVGAEKLITGHKLDQSKLLEYEQQIENDLALKRAKTIGDLDTIARAQAQIAYDKTFKGATDKGAADPEATRLAKEEYVATYDEVIKLGEKKDAQRDINDLKREESAILKDNRLQQELINQNPNLNPDQKQALLIPLLIQEREELLKNLEAWKAYLAAQTGTDPQTLSNIQVAIDKIRELTGQYQLLGFKVQLITSGVGGEVKKWADAFGTASQQIGGFITGSIYAALQSTNQLLIDAAFKTGNWQQTVASLEKSIINMFLTMLEKMALQQAISLLSIGTTTEAQVASGAAITTAQAPAAAATSISSYGAAALIGEVAAIAAIVAIMAALGGGFKAGGFTGHGADDEIAGPVHKGEFVFSKAETQNIGLARLQALQQAAPHFADGGPVEPPFLPQSYNDWLHSPQNDNSLGYGQNIWSGSDVSTFVGTGVWDGSDASAGAGTTSGSGWHQDPQTRQWYGQGEGLRGYGPYSDMVNPPAQGQWYQDPNTGQWVQGSAGFSGDLSGVGGDLQGSPSYAGNNVPWSDPPAWDGPSYQGDTTVEINPPGGSDPFGGSVASGNTGINFDGSFASGDTGINFDGSFASGDTGINPFGGSLASGDTGITTGDGYPLPGTYPAPGTPDTTAPFGSGQGFDRGNAIANTGAWYNQPGWGPTPSQIEDLGLMGRMAFGGSPNDTRGTSDEGRTQFAIGGGYQGHVDSSGVLERTAGASWNTYFDPGTAASHAADQAAYNRAWIPHRADGGRIDGSPSSIDSVLAWLAPGEHVLPADTVALLDRKQPNWANQIAQMVIPMQRPHFASGGRVGGSSSSSSQDIMGNAPIRIYNVLDPKAAMRQALQESDTRAIIVDLIKGSAHEIGIGAVNG